MRVINSNEVDMVEIDYDLLESQIKACKEITYSTPGHITAELSENLTGVIRLLEYLLGREKDEDQDKIEINGP